MKHFSLYKGHKSNVTGKRRKYDTNIYTFDIETTSYIIFEGKQYSNLYYQNLTEQQQKDCIKKSTMYLWQFSINEDVYFGRTWDDFYKFLNKLEDNTPELKIVYVHNLSFEFQFLKDVFNFSSVFARKARKVMKANLKDYNIEFKCSLMLSGVKLELLPVIYNLPVQKLVGDLDYNKIRHSKTELSEKELKYGEYDCLVVYHYIKKEIEIYGDIGKLPTTNTGKVRRELFNLTIKDYKYKNAVRKSINTNPHIYNLLVETFAGGYTHANYIYTDKVLKNINSYDIASSYPYVLFTCKYPSTKFKRCNIRTVYDLNISCAYLLVVKFTDISSKYFNNIISYSKCRKITGGVYDNGRVIRAKEIEIVLTDIDFKLILDFYDCKYEILESYYSLYKYLPKTFINFGLEKYVAKTKYKGDSDHQVEYQIQKGMFNSLYGMSVTNLIKDKVIFDDDSKTWEEVQLTNDEIIDALNKEEKKGFLSFAYGVWVTAYARNNLLRRVKELDEYVVYCDTDSIKLVQGYDEKVFTNYNNEVKKQIERVSEYLEIPISKFEPTDIKGKKHLIGVFECETPDGCDFTYEEFITQGAKKYAVKQKDKISITVSGVPKSGAKALKDLKDFKDDFIFDYKDTNKNTLMYCENMDKFLLTDYNGVKYEVNDKSGCCLLPTTYKLGKSLEYANLINDSSRRAIYNEN